MALLSRIRIPNVHRAGIGREDVVLNVMRDIPALHLKAAEAVAVQESPDLVPGILITFLQTSSLIPRYRSP